MSNYIPATDLTDAEIDELIAHDSVELDGTVFQEWRKDRDGVPWLRSLSSIQAAAAAFEQYDDGDDVYSNDDIEDGDDE